MAAFDNKGNSSWKGPTTAVSAKKAIENLKKYQSLTTSADEKAALLPEAKAFVKQQLISIKRDNAFGTKIDNGGIGDWISVNEFLTSAINPTNGLSALNAKAKEELHVLVKRSSRLGLLPADKAYFESEKICYDADRKFVDLTQMLSHLEKEIAWLERRGFAPSAGAGASTIIPKRK